jgi:hypothetical protein
MDAYLTNVYLGGSFSVVGTSNRNCLAAVDSVSGLATSWDARLITNGGFQDVTGICVHSNTVYVGGILGTIGGQFRNYAAGLDLATGNATAWDPKCNLQIIAFSGSGNTMYIGGNFGAIGCVARTNLLAYDLVFNQITAWAPAVGLRSGTPINALLAAGDKVFIGGFFTNVNGQLRTNLAALDASTGSCLIGLPTLRPWFIR